MSKHDLEWLGGRYALPDFFAESELREVVLWLEMPTGVMVSAMLLTGEDVSIAETLVNTMKEPMHGQPRRPSRIRVADAAVAEELREAAGSIPVKVAPVPELDAAFEDFCSVLGEEEPEPSYLNAGDARLIGEFFVAAGQFFRAAPWNVVFDKHLMGVDIPQYGVEGGVLTIIGAAGENFGLLLFRSIEDFEAFNHQERREPEFDPILRSMTFVDREMLPLSMLEEVEQHDWPLVTPQSYPTFFAVDADLEALDVSERDVEILIASARAFLAFFAKHPSIFNEDNPEVVQFSMTDDRDVTVTITAPYT
ncbi:MAG TPA: hypothetical protein VHW00_09165 [Thermoanaerobaculia bacterium]|nr:hypothetical protein [Thermoanaerobaculia bacterium]